jgi:hypothetical protein
MSRPVRSLTLTAKLKDASNASTPELSFQRKAVQDFRARQGQSSVVASEDGTHGSHRALSARSSFASTHISLSTGSTPSKKRSAPSSAPSVPNDSDGEEEVLEVEQGTSYPNN